jgi:hypothetical protein
VAKQARTQNPPAKASAFRWDLYIIELITRVGLVGAIVVILLTWFIWEGTTAQHREFFDKFILLKFDSHNLNYAYFILTCVVTISLAQTVYFLKRIKLKDERINELKIERDRLQDKLLN